MLHDMVLHPFSNHSNETVYRSLIKVLLLKTFAPHKNRSFSLRISSVNVAKPAGNGNLHFLCSGTSFKEAFLVKFEISKLQQN